MRHERTDPLPFIGAAGALVAVGCCAGVPAIGQILGGLTVAAVIGTVAGVLKAAAAAAGGVLLWHARRRRRACPTPTRGTPQ